MRISRPERHSLAGAYALDALAGKDLVRFERHLAGCPRCAAELRTLREAAACLGAGPRAEPPPGLAGRAIAAAARTRQVPSARRAPRAGLAGVRVPRAGLAGVRAPRAQGVVVVVAAVAVIAAGFLGVAARNAVSRLGQQESRAQAIAAVLAAPDATVLTARVTTGGRATIIMSARRHALVFTATSLATVPPSDRYELWFMGPSGDRPAGMLPPATGGMTGPVLACGLRRGDHLGLTVEPASGSRRPSTAVLLTVAL